MEETDHVSKGKTNKCKSMVLMGKRKHTTDGNIKSNLYVNVCIVSGESAEDYREEDD